MTESELKQRLAPIVATTLLFALFGWLLLGLFTFSLSLHALLLASVGALMACGRLLGIGIDELRDGLFQGIQDAIPALVIFLMIGVLMASFMLSGTVPSLLYYGLYLLSPRDAHLMRCYVECHRNLVGNCRHAWCCAHRTGAGLWPLARAHRGCSHCRRKLR